jgi:pimeloyl-ACP methyl ester carboxylesterase
VAVAAATLLTLAASGCTLPGRERPAPGDAGASGTAGWRDCTADVREELGRRPANMTYECTTIQVPRDWAGGAASEAASGASAGPDGFEIALLRARSTAQRDRIGSLLVNPGGPGGSGVQLAMFLSVGLPADVLRRFDIVGFDPRGVGRSSPVKCFSDELLDRSFGFEPDPVSQADFDGAVAIAREMGQACGAKYGDSLPLFSTEQAARDMEAIRAAVGDGKLTYLGYSYGTLLGATYAQLFPRSIRALVLDGAVDPTQDDVASSESQAKGFERAYGNFADWCTANVRDCAIAPDARGAVNAALESARRSPVQGTDGRKATAGWIMTAIVSSLYSKSDWEDLANAVDDLRGGDPAGIFQRADSYADRDPSGHYTNLFDANSAINCADSDEKTTVAQVRELQSQWRQKYPMFGGPSAIGLLTCALWPGKRDPYPTGRAEGAPPIVVVGTTGDPATPYEQTPKLAEMLGTGVVLTWQGEGHTAYPETRCVSDAVNTYLIQVKPPAAGKTCPAG